MKSDWQLGYVISRRVVIYASLVMYTVAQKPGLILTVRVDFFK